VVIVDGLSDLRLSIHDEVAIGGHRLAYGCPVEHQKAGDVPGVDAHPLSLAGILFPSTSPLFFVMTQLPHGRQVIESVESPPQGYRSRFAVVLASHKSSQLRDPAHGLPHGRRLLGRHGPLLHIAAEGFPFGLAQPSVNPQAMAGPRTTALGHRESNPSHAGRNSPRRPESGASAQRRLGPGDFSAPLQRLQTTVGQRAAQAGGDLARLGGGKPLQPPERYPSYHSDYSI